MREVTYEIVQPLVKQAERIDNTVHVLFACPVSGDEFQAVAQIDGAAVTTVEAKPSLWRSIRSSLARMTRSVTREGGDGGDGAPPQAMQDAIMDAFHTVAPSFAWDEEKQQLVSLSAFRDLQTEFANLVRGARITDPWDREVLARMMAEVANVDGHIADGERAHFRAFFGDDLGVEDLLAKPPLRAKDIERTTDQWRYVMWLLAAAMAYSDERLADPEKRKLIELGKLCGIGMIEAARGLELAKEYVYDQALEAVYANRQVDVEEHRRLIAIARSLGVNDDRAARLDSRCRKRKGLA